MGYRILAGGIKVRYAFIPLVTHFLLSSLVVSAEEGSTAPAKTELKIKTNRWEYFKPQLMLRKGLNLDPENTKTGGYGYNNMWGAILYRECTNEIVLFDGWNGSLDGERIGYTSIYANALYGVDPVGFKMTQYDILRWRRGDNGMTEHPSNKARPTPWPRHTAGTMAYAPELDRIFLYRGAAMHGAPDPLWEFWEYSFKEDAWTPLEQNKDKLPPRGNRSTGYLGNTLVFFPDKDAGKPGMLYFFEGTGRLPVWTYDLSAKKWAKRSDQVMPVNVGFAGSCVDSKRRRILFIGGSSGDMYDEDDRCLIWAYHVDDDKWEKVAASGDIPSGRKQWLGVCLDAEQDHVIAYGGDESLHTSVLDLEDSAWKRLNIKPAVGPGTGKSRKKLYTYIAFDSKDGLAILQQNDEWFRLKLDIQKVDSKP